MGALPFAFALVAGCVVVFAVSIKVGILLGLRLDRVLEARAAADEPESAQEDPHD
jgi:hypothetical protein